jgi:tripartite-type tricarboxylate transporter receptor subunit TctC
MNVITLNPLLYKKLSYDADRDFAPVMLYSDTPHVLMISSAAPATKLQEFIAHAKANAATIHFGSGGHGTSQHLSGELLKIRAGIDLRHVPYKGSGQAVPAIISNEIQMIFESISTAIGHIRGGRIRGLGVASRARAPVLPDVPTMEEGGFPGFTSGVWAGVVVRNGTPAAVVNTLNRSINTVTSDADYKKQMSDLGINLVGGTPEQLTAYIASEPVIQKLNLKLD